MIARARCHRPVPDHAQVPSLRCAELVPSPQAAASKAALILRCGRLQLYSLPTSELFSSQKERLKHIVTVNAEIFTYAHENPEMERILAGTLNTIDGRVLQWMCSLFYPRWNIRRLPGSDFIYELAAYCAARSERLYLLGASPESNRRAVEALQGGYPGLRVLGYAPPFCTDIRDPQWNAAIFREIEKLQPTHLAVCFGPVKQETWISHNVESLFSMGVRCAYGLGGTLDFVSGTKRRAPKWVQMIGAEWLFRFLCEPRQRLHRTLTMFKMPYYAAHTPCLEVRLVALSDN